MSAPASASTVLSSYCPTLGCNQMVPDRSLTPLDKKVKEFTCGHQFCLACEETVNKAIKCPVCKANPGESESSSLLPKSTSLPPTRRGAVESNQEGQDVSVKSSKNKSKSTIAKIALISLGILALLAAILLVAVLI